MQLQWHTWWQTQERSYYFICTEVRGITSTCFLLMSYNHVLNPRISNYKEGNRHVRVLLNCTARKTAILTDICQLLLCHSQNGGGGEDGDAEEHFTARMRWLQQHHWEVSSCLWTGWLSSGLHQQMLPNNTSRIIDLLLLLFSDSDTIKSWHVNRLCFLSTSTRPTQLTLSNAAGQLSPGWFLQSDSP